MTFNPIIYLCLNIICILCVWYKAFTWMRMFDRLLIFINSLNE